MVEAAPPAPFIIAEAELLLELLIIALDPHRNFVRSTRRSKAVSSGKVENQYLVGSVSSSGHSIRSHSSARNSLSKLSRCAGRTLCRAKREASQSVVPSRQVIVCHASCGRLRASVLTEIGWCCPRCSRVCGRPRPVRDCGGRGASPGGHTEVLGPIPAT